MANLGRLALCILLASYISSCGKPAKRRSSGTPQASVVDTNLVEAGTAQPVKDVLTPSSPSEFRTLLKVVELSLFTFGLRGVMSPLPILVLLNECLPRCLKIQI